MSAAGCMLAAGSGDMKLLEILGNAVLVVGPEMKPDRLQLGRKLEQRKQRQCIQTTLSTSFAPHRIKESGEKQDVQ